MAKARIAVFSPVRPVSSGVSDYCEESLALMADEVDLHLYLDGYAPEHERLHEITTVHQVNTFEKDHSAQPFDLIIYHIGNAPCHDYIYPFLYKYPGMLVLHDAWLMGTALNKALRAWGGDQFRAEMAAAYGEKGESAAEIILSGLDNQNFLRYFPMVELPVQSSLMTVVHDQWLAERLSVDIPGAEIRSIPLRVSLPQFPKGAGKKVRSHYNIPDDAFVLGSFGYLSPDKRIETLLKAFRELLKKKPGSRLLLTGAKGENLPLDDMLNSLGLETEVIVTGSLSDEDYFDHMASCDAVAALRWPTRRESSGIVITAMHFGLPVIVSDLAQFRDYPDDALVRISVNSERESLRAALFDIADCRPLRERIGGNAKRYIRKHHSAKAVKARWLSLIEEAQKLVAAVKIDSSFLPKHLRI